MLTLNSLILIKVAIDILAKKGYFSDTLLL